MNQLLVLLIIASICFVVPINFLIIFSVVGVMLADTRLVPGDIIYYSRFVPIGILASRVLLSLFMKRSTEKIDFSMVKTWTPFLLFASVSIIYSLEPSMSAQRVFSAWLVMIGFGIGIPLFFPTTEDLQRIVVLFSFFMGGAILYSYHSMPSEQYVMLGAEEYERFAGIFRNPNTMGLLAMQAIFPLMYLWKKEKKKTIRNILLLILILFGVAIMISGSRAAALGFLTGLMIILWGNSKIQHKTMSTFFMGMLFLASIYVIVGYFYPEFAGSLFRSGTGGRTGIGEHEWELAQESPFWGVGFGGSDGLYMRDAWRLRMQGIYVPGSHNSYMRLLVELGFAGLLIALFSFAKVIGLSIKYFRRFDDPELGISMLAVVVASLVNSIFESWLFGFGNSSTIPFWLFLSMLYYQIDKAKKRTPDLSHSRSSMPNYIVKPF